MSNPNPDSTVLPSLQDSLDQTMQSSREDAASEAGSEELENANDNLQNVHRRSAPTNSNAQGHIKFPLMWFKACWMRSKDLHAQVGQLQNQQMAQQQVVVAPIVAPTTPIPTPTPTTSATPANSNTAKLGANM